MSSRTSERGDTQAPTKAPLDRVAAEDTVTDLPPKKKAPKFRPCQSCRDRHLKCRFEKDAAVCTRCQRSGEECIPSGTKFKFRHGSSARYDSGFSRDQPWLSIANKLKKLEYVDETGDVVAFYARDVEEDQDSDPGVDDDEGQTETAAQSTEFHGLDTSVGSEDSTAPIVSPISARSRLQQVEAFDSPKKRRRTNESRPQSALSNNERDLNLSHSFLVARRNTNDSQSYSVSGDQWNPFRSPLPSLTSQVTPGAGEGIGTSPFFSSLVKTPVVNPSPEYSDELRALLLRYFIDNLARWFDLCDPERHFELVVPQRSRVCPPLMNAILTASARHITRLQKYRTSAGLVQYEGHVFPGLGPETALHYHNECIKDLITLSMDPDQIHDENLLAAAIVLRFYEEVDQPLRGGDQDHELFLQVINIFINAQAPAVPALPHSSPEIMQSTVAAADAIKDMNQTLLATTPTSSHTQHTPPGMLQPYTVSTSDPTPRVTRADGLRQACFWVAFRQEIYTAFMKQRPFTLPLSRCEAFRSFSPAEDAVWADRLIIFCADVLQFCYGSHSHDQNAARERWLELKQYEKIWTTVLPQSFEPIFFRDPDPLRGEVFPEIWYLNDCHVTGIQHVELARILLAVYDPLRPRLGPGHVASMRTLSAELRAVVARLCGIALSNRKTPPAIVTAGMGIAMCGEHFEKPEEQDALLNVLAELADDHAWPIGETISVLKGAWGRD